MNGKNDLSEDRLFPQSKLNKFYSVVLLYINRMATFALT